MKLQRNNKYIGKIAIGLASLITSGVIMSGCTDYESVYPLNSLLPQIEITETLEPTPNFEPTPVPTPEQTQMIDPISTEEPSEIEEPIEDDIWFTRLTPEEEKDAIEKLGIVEIDGDLFWGNCYSANLYVNGQPKIIFGRVYYSDVEGEYLFQSLFTGEDLFIYKSTNPDNLSVTWSSRDKGPLEYKPIHPYFRDNECEIAYVSYSTIAINFLVSEGGLDLEDQSNFEYLFGIVPQETNNHDLTSLEEQAHIYVSIVPEEMRITAVDLEMAKEQHTKKLG